MDPEIRREFEEKGVSCVPLARTQIKRSKGGRVGGRENGTLVIIFAASLLKVLYTRNYNGQKTFLTDPTMLKVILVVPIYGNRFNACCARTYVHIYVHTHVHTHQGWQDVFETQEKCEVEEELRRVGLDYSWGKKDALRILNKEAAVEPHPLTGERVWFNHVQVCVCALTYPARKWVWPRRGRTLQLQCHNNSGGSSVAYFPFSSFHSGPSPPPPQVFHWSMIPEEYHRIYKRLGNYKYLLLSWLTWILKLLVFAFLGSARVGFHTSFADGSEIPLGHMNHVRDVIWRNMVFNRWRKGDILMIDNFRMSHGRQVSSTTNLDLPYV